MTPQRKTLEEYLAKFPEDRKTTGECPCCKSEIGALKPSIEDEPFDSAITCPDCDFVFFRTVYNNGTVKAELLPA